MTELEEIERTEFLMNELWMQNPELWHNFQDAYDFLNRVEAEIEEVEV